MSATGSSAVLAAALLFAGCHAAYSDIFFQSGTHYTYDTWVSEGANTTGDISTCFDNDALVGGPFNITRNGATKFALKYLEPVLLNDMIFYYRCSEKARIVSAKLWDISSDSWFSFKSILVQSEPSADTHLRTISFNVNETGYYTDSVNFTMQADLDKASWLVVKTQGYYSYTPPPTTTQTPTTTTLTPTSTTKTPTTTTLTPTSTTLTPTTTEPPPPTWEHVWGKTILQDGDKRVQYSENIYPLRERNMTYSTYEVPKTCKTKGDGSVECKRTPYCSTCVLAYSEIDTKLQVLGCEEESHEAVGDDIGTPSDFYFCEGTWKLTSTARLVDWQQTYGRVEIWEVDDRGTKWRQFQLEFQWNNSQCAWTQTEGEDIGEVTKCTLLPLTAGNNRTARIEFEMPKYVTDERERPLIVVWYDLLSIPYSLRPQLNYTWWNYTGLYIEEGENYGFSDLRKDERFMIPIMSALGLTGLFLVILLLSCFGFEDRTKKSQYMLDTRNLKEVFMHKREWLVVPESEIVNRSHFVCLKHGPYLLIVLISRLAYMLVFTFTFFGIVFTSINREHFDVIKQYDDFAFDRDNQLKNMSSKVEGYYYNETDRMDRELESRVFWCYAAWINLTSDVFDNGTYWQYVRHTNAMNAPLKYVSMNLSESAVSYKEGDNACNTLAGDGAVVLFQDSLLLGITGNGTVTGAVGNVTNATGSTNVETVTIEAKKWSRSWTNWTANVYDLLDQFCLGFEDCSGWTWIDETPTSNASFVLFRELAEPILDTSVNGSCYVIQRYDSTSLSFDNLYAMQNISSQLEAQYMDAYMADTDSMMDAVNGLWAAMQTVDDSSNVHWDIQVSRDPTADFETDVNMLDFTCDTSKPDWNCSFNMQLIVNCPNCPVGNLSSPVMQEVYEYIGGTSYNDEDGFANDANFSDQVQVNTPLLEEPDLPTVDMPLDIKFPINLFAIFQIGMTLDILLTIYRWFKTAGMMAAVIRGRDKQIQLKHLMLIKPKMPLCCPKDAKSLADTGLSSLMCCDRYIKNAIYECWKFGYWIWVLFNLALICAFLLFLYYILDQVLTEDFVDALGIFDLLTVGLAAQRAVRNEVIASTSAQYNNYTIAQIVTNRQSYAIEKNLLALDWNRMELARVDEWNAYFCQIWGNYHTTVRDVTADANGKLKHGDSGDLGTGSKPENLFDKNETSHFVPFPDLGEASSNVATDVFIDIELPAVVMRERTNTTVYWNVNYLKFDWAFDSADVSSAATSVPFSFEYKLKKSESWKMGSASDSAYYGPVDDTSGEVIDESQQVNVEFNETKYLRVTFSTAGTWDKNYRLKALTVYANIAPENILCPYVQFEYFDYDANELTTLYCPVISPILGIMYRGWVREWLADALFEAHKPFIRAVRNVALSPFFIMTVLVSFLIMFTLLAFFLEWVLRMVDLYRENPYSKIPLVVSEADVEYDKALHEIDIFQEATVGQNYYRASTVRKSQVIDPRIAQIAIAELQSGRHLTPSPRPHDVGTGTGEQQPDDGTYHYGDEADTGAVTYVAAQPYAHEQAGAGGAAVTYEPAVVSAAQVRGADYGEYGDQYGPEYGTEYGGGGTELRAQEGGGGHMATDSTGYYEDYSFEQGVDDEDL